MTENFDSDIITIESDDESCSESVEGVASQHDSHKYKAHSNDLVDYVSFVDDDPDAQFLRDLDEAIKLSLQDYLAVTGSRHVLFDDASGSSTKQADTLSLHHNQYGQHRSKTSLQTFTVPQRYNKNVVSLNSALLYRSCSETATIKDSGVNLKKTLSSERLGNVKKQEVRQTNFGKRCFGDMLNGDCHETNVIHSIDDPKQRNKSNVKNKYLDQKLFQIDEHQSREKESYKKCLNDEISMCQSLKTKRCSITLTEKCIHWNCDKDRNSRNDGRDTFNEKHNSSVLRTRNNVNMSVMDSGSAEEVGSCLNKLNNSCKISRHAVLNKAGKCKEENDGWQIQEENESGLKRRHSPETLNKEKDLAHSSNKRLCQTVSKPDQPVLEPIFFTLDPQENADFSDGSLPDLDPPTIEREDVYLETDSSSFKSPKLLKNGNQQSNQPYNVIKFIDLDDNEKISETKECGAVVCENLKATEQESMNASLGKNSLWNTEHKSDSSSKQILSEKRLKQFSCSESKFPGCYSEFSYSNDKKNSKSLHRHSQLDKSIRSLWCSVLDDGKTKCTDGDCFQGTLDSDDDRSHYFQARNKNIASSESLNMCKNSLQIMTSEASSLSSFISEVNDLLSKANTLTSKEELKLSVGKNDLQDFSTTGENKFKSKLHQSQSCPIMDSKCSTRTNIFEAFSYKNKDNDRSTPPWPKLSPEAKKTLKEKLEVFKSKIKIPLRVKDRSKEDKIGGQGPQDSRHFLDIIQKEPSLVDGNVCIFGKEEKLQASLLQKSKLIKFFATKGLEVHNEKGAQASNVKYENDGSEVPVSDMEHSTSDRQCIDETKLVTQLSGKTMAEEAILLPIIPTIPEINSERTSVTRKVNLSSDSKFGKGLDSKKDIKSYFFPTQKKSSGVLLSSLEMRKKVLIAPSSRFPFESMLDSACKQMTQLHINTIEGCFEEGMLFLSHGLKFLNDVCFRCKPTSDMVGRIVKSAFFQDKNVSVQLVQYAYQTLMIINQVYPGLIHVDWILIEDCLHGIISSRNLGNGIGTQTQACLLLSLLTNVLIDDLFNRDISDQRQIQFSMAFKVISYDTSRSNIEVIVDYIRCILCGISDHAINAGLTQCSPNSIEYKVLPILQRLLDLAVNVSRSCEDCAAYVATRLLQMYMYLPGLGHKKLLFQTIISDLLAYKLSQLVLEKEYDNIMPLGGFPDSLASVFESFFGAVPYKNHLTPPTTPTSDDGDNGVARSTIEDVIDPMRCEELCMLLFYSVKSYLLSSQGKLHVALRRRAQYAEKEHCTLRSQDVDNLGQIPEQLENLRERLLSMSREISPDTEHYLMMMNSFSQLAHNVT